MGKVSVYGLPMCMHESDKAERRRANVSIDAGIAHKVTENESEIRVIEYGTTKTGQRPRRIIIV